MALTRAQQAYRQWIDTFIATGNYRHLKTAAACQRIATEEIAGIIALHLLQKVQWERTRTRRFRTREQREQ